MGRRDFNRPTFRTRGRSTESITGSDVPSEFRATPRLPIPKADQRREAERALRDFMGKKPSHQQPLKPVSIMPPDDDDGEAPF
jgi:hypothetical protein